jgi:hypothetical protein
VPRQRDDTDALADCGVDDGRGGGGGGGNLVSPNTASQPAKPTSSTTGTTIAGTRSKRSNHSAMALRAYPTSAGNSPVISVIGYFE